MKRSNKNLFVDTSVNSHRVDKKRDKMERQILDSQERAFWNVHRPPVRNLK